MTLTDELKILDDKIKANQALHELDREATKISALSSIDLLQKYEYLAGEDLVHRPSMLEKTKLSIIDWACHLVNYFKKLMSKILQRARARAILLMTVTINFMNFTKGMMNLKRCH